MSKKVTEKLKEILICKKYKFIQYLNNLYAKNNQINLKFL